MYRLLQTTMVPMIVLMIVLQSASSLCVLDAYAFGKKKTKPKSTPPKPAIAKKVIQLNPLREVQIELPNRKFHNFGMEFEERLKSKLIQTGRYVLYEKQPETAAASTLSEDDDFVWPGSATPTAEIDVSVESLGFMTGTGGRRMFYGFDDRFRNEFNGGLEKVPNEFPLKRFSGNPSWFGESFEQKGSGLDHSRVGLDLTEGIEFNFLFAWLKVKYEKFKAVLDLKFHIRSPLNQHEQIRLVQVQGEGYFYDVVGAYAGFSVGIQASRTDAMLKAMERAVGSTIGTLDRSLKSLPSVGKVDHVVVKDGELIFLLGTGPQAGVLRGTLYEVLSAPGVYLRVTKSNTSGSIARIARGDGSAVRVGMIVREIEKLPDSDAPVLAAATAVNADGLVGTIVDNVFFPPEKYPRPDFEGGAPNESYVEAFFKSLIGVFLLPYRYWRMNMYDRALEGKPDRYSERYRFRNSEDWSFYSAGRTWGQLMGIQPRSSRRVYSPVVAVIDSGVDYNHPVIFHSAWRNPSARKDARGRLDQWGWDFISNDERPSDDGYHGTEVASAVLAVSPESKILPLKIFNPSGVTNSAAILASVQYAIEKDADIIVMAWATGRESEAIERALELARDAGVLVVVSAGDGGGSLGDRPLYPAVLSEDFENMITVAGLTERHSLLATGKGVTGHGARYVQIGAIGGNVLVTSPRDGYQMVSSPDVSTGFVAGALARIGSVHGANDRLEWRQFLLDEAVQQRDLDSAIQNGRVLRVPQFR